MSIYRSEDDESQAQGISGQEAAGSVDTATTTTLAFPPLTHQRLENCSFSAWYPHFRSLTIKSKIIPLPEEFVSYLNADGVFIPGQSGITMALSDSDSEGEDDQVSDMDRLKALQEETFRQAKESVDDSSDDDEEDEDQETALPYFPALEQEIENAIENLGGEVFPKLNWSSPRDASWIATTNTLKCHNVADIFLLLKSSDFIAHDLAHAYEDCSDEAGGQAGISQRDMTYYEFLKGIKDELEQKIVDFYDEKIKGKFPDCDYTFDVYITRNKERIYLIDFNPLAQKTDALLFEWEELLQAQERIPMRLLASEAAGQHMHQPFAFNRYPSDVTDLSNGQTVADFAEAFYKKVQAAAK
ncbi:hypothetical protein BGZ51_005578 [Haplosporangium sp. Z 767]|nr:hypothetical protein BGZ51_005578 [Haplosporangium sp. Z 767]KAF9184434.1 hypothetical protein BGZ50_003717 [Haplosporangium sp. Z 11]